MARLNERNLPTLYRPVEQKLIRARNHISEFKVEFSNYLDAGPFQFVVVTDVHAGRKYLQIEQIKEIPDVLSLIAGDAIHNARSALDACIWSLIGEKARNKEGVQFPFCRSAEKLAEVIKKREIELAGPEVVELIKASRPYPGGNPELDFLHKLDIIDKHRNLILVGRAAYISGDQIKNIFPELPISGGGKLKYVGTDRVLLQMNFPRPSRNVRRANPNYRPSRLVAEFSPAIEMVLGEEGLNLGVEVLQLLNDICKTVEDLSLSLCRASLID